ncbi:MAG: multicopper oxidase family protein [Synechococcales cyanobacterium K44_A2020_017]|nr:multicopper oxidase family protein [Synechococcales cyanobacterium K32_A2020_035]MBF2093805.1 multicopper oxidase family protein [Synechococcales cyanobacterium K44_A2020_017]
MINRRHFLTLAGATAGTIALSRCVSSTISRAQPLSDRFISQGGLLEVDLTARMERLDLLGDGRPVQVMTYNGQMPGPILEAHAGDTIRIRFTNELAAPTNLHYHGLHIPPTGTADNVFLSVPPGETFTYDFTLPTDHPAGTFWYHPHHHGLVAEQVFGGLSGVLIVRGALDDIPEVQAASEAILVLKDFDVSQQQIATPSPMFQMWGREGSVLTVNGQRRPSFTIPQDGLLRLRIINASASRFYRLAIASHPMHWIASDAGALEAPVTVEEVLLTPGERAEVLVHGTEAAGEYELLNLPYDRGLMAMMQGMDNQTVQDQPEVLAQLVYGDRTTVMAPPTQLLPIEALPEPSQVRTFVLNHGMGGGMGGMNQNGTQRGGMGMPGMNRGGMGGMHRGGMGGGMMPGFLINGQMFDHHRVDTEVQLNTVEDWEIINDGGMDHPFHIHVNPFQVIERNGVAEPYRAWKDTVLVPRYERVRIRVPFDQFSGMTVYHCHILDHEDRGMMGILDIRA